MDSPRRPKVLASPLMKGAILLVALLALPIFCLEVVHRTALQPLGQLHGTAPTKAALVAKITQDLRTMHGASREEVHAYFSTIGGVVHVRDFGGGRGGLQEEAVYWELAELAGGKIWIAFLLRYNSQDELVEVSSGS